MNERGQVGVYLMNGRPKGMPALGGVADGVGHAGVGHAGHEVHLGARAARCARREP